MNVIYDLKPMIVTLVSVVLVVLFQLFVIARVDEKWKFRLFIATWVVWFISLTFVMWYLTDVGFIEPCPEYLRNLSAI